VAGRVGNHQKLSIDSRLIANLMRFTRLDLDSLAWVKHNFAASDLDGESSRKHIEELVRLPMKVPNLGSARRHSLFDNAQCRRLDEVPSIATVTPGVVLGCSLVDHSPSVGRRLDRLPYQLKS